MTDKKFIITIGRERGSGGRMVGKMLAERFNIPYYDNELLRHAAEELDTSEEFLRNLDERTVLLMKPEPYESISSFYYLPTAAELVGVQTRLIREFASRGSCVIVGRCADYFLSDYPNCFNIFLHSHMKDRILHAAQVYHIPTEDARRLIKQVDRERSRYYKECTGNDWGKLQNYDLCINTSTTGIEKAADIAECFIRTVMDMPK